MFERYYVLRVIIYSLLGYLIFTNIALANGYFEHPLHLSDIQNKNISQQVTQLKLPVGALPSSPKNMDMWLNTLSEHHSIRLTGDRFLSAFTVLNDTDIEEWFIYPYGTPIEKVDVRVYSDTQLKRQIDSGLNSLNEIPFHYGGSVKIAKGERLKVLVLTESRFFVAPIKLVVKPKDSAYKQLRIENIILLISIGVCLALGLFNFFIFVKVRSRQYLYFASSTVSMTFVWSLVFGVTSYESVGATPVLPLICAGIALSFKALFTREFLQLKKQSPRLALILKISAVTSLCTVVIAPFNYGLAIKVIHAVSTIIIVLSFYSGIRSWSKGYGPAKYFVLALIMVGSPNFISNLINLSIIPSFNVNVLMLAQLGNAFESILLAFALAEKVRLINSENKALNHQLELTVQKRTTQLSQANQELEVLVEKLRETNNAKKRLFANVSHEFRTPLSLIIGPMEVLLDKLKDKTVQKQVDLIHRNAKRLNHLVDQILELAKLDSVKSIPLKSYPIKSSISIIAESFQTLAELKTLDLNVDVKCDGTTELFEGSLEQILSNLLSNAIKYTEKGGRISISVSKRNGELELCVEDNGSGMTASEQSQIFERFIRLEGTENISGTGIGLALVKELVEANKGHVDVNSKVGEGSVFTVTLPMKEPENAICEPTELAMSDLTYDFPEEFPNQNSSSVQEEPGKPTLLVVEDNSDMRNFIVDSLEEDYHCLTAENGNQGLEMAIEHIPDLIISDLMMPGRSGLELIETLRGGDMTAHIPFVLLTAKGDDTSRIEGWKLDIDDYITKPFDVKELNVRLARLLSIRNILAKRQGRITNESLEKTSVKRTFSDIRDESFYEKFKQVVDSHYHEEKFNRASVAEKMSVSERQVNRKLKALIDVNFAEYLRKYRLEKAKKLLTDGEQITAVCYMVGFSSASYFSRCFRAEYGYSPKEFVES